MTLSEFKAWFSGMETILSRTDASTTKVDWYKILAEIKEQVDKLTNDHQSLPFVKPSFTEEEINRYKSNINKMTHPAVVDPFLNSKMPNTWNEIRLSDKKPPVIT